jgi:hypothetical protein
MRGTWRDRSCPIEVDQWGDGSAATSATDSNDIARRFIYGKTAPQLTAICEDATRLGISAGEIGRRILDNWLETRPRNESVMAQYPRGSRRR